MGDNSYRKGRAQVLVLLPLALKAQVVAAARSGGLSMQEFIVDAVRTAVSTPPLAEEASGAFVDVPLFAEESVEPDGPDWDAMMKEGRDSRLSLPPRRI